VRRIRFKPYFVPLIPGCLILLGVNLSRFTHPAMTETQLFLHQWPFIVGGVILILAAYFLYRDMN